MENLKVLNEELKIETSSSSIHPPACLSLYSCEDRSESSSKFVGYQQLANKGKYVLCMSNAIHLCKDSQLIDSFPFSKNGVTCHTYLYIEKCNFGNDEVQPVHALAMNDRSILLCRLKGNSFQELKKVNVISDSWEAYESCLCTATSNGMLISVDHKTIKQWDFKEEDPSGSAKLDFIHKTHLGELLHFEFMEAEKTLLCFFRHISTGGLYAELAQYQSGRYVISRRYPLTSSLQGKFIVKRLSESWIICFTLEETYSFKNNYPPKILPNKGLLSCLNDFVHLDWRICGSRVLLRVFCSLGRVFQTFLPIRPKTIKKLDWSENKLAKGPPFTINEMEFLTEIVEGLYLAVLKSDGVKIIDTNKPSITEIMPCCQEPIYFDGNCVPNGGTDFDSSIFCGAYSENLGFIEKRTLQYENHLVDIVSSRPFAHIPVTNLWSTDLGLVYESMGTLYRAGCDEKLRDFENGIWLTEKCVAVFDEQDDVLFINKLTGKIDERLCFSTISRSGRFQVINCRGPDIFEVLLSMNLGPCVIDVAKAAATYDNYEKCYYSACYFELGWLCLFRDTETIQKICLGLDFFASDMLIKMVKGSVYVVVTSADGRGRIYSSKSKEILLEVSGIGKNSLRLLDLGSHTPFALFYNENNSILTCLDGMRYGNLALGFRPLIISSAGEGEPSLYYAVDEQWTLNVVKILESFEASMLVLPNSKPDVKHLPDRIPLHILPVMGSSLAVLLIKEIPRRMLCIGLFDYYAMKFVDRYDISEGCSNILLKPFWDQELPCHIFPDPLLQKLFIITGVHRNESFFQIFRLDRSKIVLLQHEQLLHPVLAIDFIPNEAKIIFGGVMTAIFDIVLDMKKESILLQNISCADSSNAKLETAILCTSEGFNLIHPFAGSSELNFVGPGIPPNVENCTNGNRFDLITKTATKRVEQNFTIKEHEASEVAAHKGGKLLTSAEILYRFTKTPKSSMTGLYVIMVDYYDKVYVFHGRGGTLGVDKKNNVAPLCCFKCSKAVNNVSPISGNFRNVQTSCGSVSGRLIETTPLFMITCTEGLTYMLMELRGELALSVLNGACQEHFRISFEILGLADRTQLSSDFNKSLRAFDV